MTRQTGFGGQPTSNNALAIFPSLRAKRCPGTGNGSTMAKPLVDKSVGAALVLTFLFGPLGLLYVSILGGIVMIVITPIVAIATFGIGLAIVWPIIMLWAAFSASSQHSRYEAWLAKEGHSGESAGSHSEAQAQPEAGWYRDPRGAAESRWWDGTRWTEHVR